MANAYVIDHRNLALDELRSAIKKTAPQYYFEDNVRSTIRNCVYNIERDCRTLAPILLQDVLLQKDGVILSQSDTNDELIKREQRIVDESNEDVFKQGGKKRKTLELFHFVLETAWENDDEISLDEKHLIERIKERLRITDNEYRIIEATLGKFPNPGNRIHTLTEIETVRRDLQSKGLIFPMRDSDGTNFDVIPEELGETLRSVFGIEIRRHGFVELTKHRFVKRKAYLTEILEKCDIELEGGITVDGLRELVLEQVQPTILLGGLSPRDGLDIETLRKWCNDLRLTVSGSKAELISKIVSYYDGLHETKEDIKDEREIWYSYYKDFAGRNLKFLREQQLIQKDLETEKKFEGATDYIFEKLLRHKPLSMIGSNHPDGAVSFQNRVIYWDNKSKEQPVSLKEHLKQFDGYIRDAEKVVAAFLVIGPDFTPDSSSLAMQYQVENGTTITLMSAEELKALADEWNTKGGGKTDEPFPLGYLIQPGRFNRALLPEF